MGDGTYILEFAVAYQGNYKIQISLNNAFYGNAINFWADNIFCNITGK